MWSVCPTETAAEGSRRFSSDLLPVPTVTSRLTLDTQDTLIVLSAAHTHTQRDNICFLNFIRNLFFSCSAGIQFPFDEEGVNRDGVNRDSAIIGGKESCTFGFFRVSVITERLALKI